MPYFMDVHHHMQGLTPEGVATAHQRDLAVQDKYGAKFLKYWYDEATGRIFCLSWATTKEAVLAVHREANGETADEIWEVKEGE
jgi:hypothetical protein